MNDAWIFAAAGLVAGFMAWRNGSQGDSAPVIDDGGSPVDSVVDTVDDFVAQNFGVHIVGNWRDDLNGRGAPYKPMLAAAESRYGIPSGMLARLAWQESRFRADIISGKTVSSAGALGIMQIVPKWHPGVNPLVPGEAIDYAGRYLSSLYRQFGSWELALKAYNWGAGNVKAWLAGNKSEPLETRLYSSQILADIGGGVVA